MQIIIRNDQRQQTKQQNAAMAACCEPKGIPLCQTGIMSVSVLGKNRRKGAIKCIKDKQKAEEQSLSVRGGSALSAAPPEHKHS